ncbi:hypothetical protein HD806DRAFT_505899 [Xylariaceae sp. AK1471]|nr:hypothetical protein HD806DRAFT_505899 [Xylariaceae sp. AK1471]
MRYDKKGLNDWVMAIDLKNPAATFNFQDWEVMTVEPSPISLVHESANIQKERAGHKHKYGEKTTTPKPRFSHRNAPVPAMGSLTNDRAKQNNSQAKNGSSSGGVRQSDTGGETIVVRAMTEQLEQLELKHSRAKSSSNSDGLGQNSSPAKRRRTK